MAEDIEKIMDKRNMMGIKVDFKAPDDHDFTMTPVYKAYILGQSEGESLE